MPEREIEKSATLIPGVELQVLAGDGQVEGTNSIYAMTLGIGVKIPMHVHEGNLELWTNISGIGSISSLEEAIIHNSEFMSGETFVIHPGETIELRNEGQDNLVILVATAPKDVGLL